MAISLKHTKTGTTTVTNKASESNQKDEPEQPAPAPAPQKKSVAKAPKTGIHFIKRGSEAKADMEKEELKIEASKNRIYRFRIPEGADSSITFLDGDMSPNGILDIPYYYEHTITIGGKYQQFICTQDVEPCPICQNGSKASYVGIMTVIDHSSYVSKIDNKTHRDEVRLFVCKRNTQKQLGKIAAKREGLRGLTFDVSRIGDKSASVGSAFDFVSKLTESQLLAKYPDKAFPVDYDEYLTSIYMPAAELRKMGFGTQKAAIGTESAHYADYEDKL